MKEDKICQTDPPIDNFLGSFEQELLEDEIKELMTTLYQGDVSQATYTELETAYNLALICLNKKQEECEESLKTNCIKALFNGCS